MDEDYLISTKMCDNMHLSTKNATVSRTLTQDQDMEDTYYVYTTIRHPRTF